MGPPASLYAPSTRLLARYTKTYVYPAHFQTRRVNDAGDIRWHKSRVFINEVFRGEDIGLEKVEDNFYRIYFCTWRWANSILRLDRGCGFANCRRSRAWVSSLAADTDLIRRPLRDLGSSTE